MWALQYRPKTFDQVVEQTSAIKALTGAEKSYSTIILHGESGTGKTTLARIFADSINGEALEINGADNNGVDNVRALLASAVYSPIMNDYRVFIIDECHMLTNAAWNALLKILEESPKTTKWVLCTTEFSKIPTTIKSRSLIVKVDKISKAGIRKQLTDIIATEEHEVQEDVLAEIINRSEGRMREAITTLEAYVTSGNLPYSFTTLDAIKLLTLTMSGKAKVAIPIIDKLTNEDVYVIIKMLNDYMKLLILRQELPQTITAETILNEYTSISPSYLPQLRELQDALWVSSTERGEQWSVTLKLVYNIYDKMMSHYNDFRDSRLAVSFALLETMGGIKSSV